MTEAWIDLRSDTITHPTPAMRAAMAQAEVGDDVYGEDPTVNRLEQMAAERMGKQSGLLVTSGTMGNLIGVLAACQRGDEVIMGDKAHTALFEGGGISALGSVYAHTLVNQPDGTLRLEDIRAAIRGSDIHQPVSRLLVLENTHNRCGGTVLPVEYLRAAGELAHEHGLSFHLDGARIFNAAAACGVPVAKIVAPADTVTFCLSKGLCAPVGSVLCGSFATITRARRLRKMLGGGMRQAGILAAAGIVALEEMTDRLAEDHARAQRLARLLAEVPGLKLTYGLPETNLLFVSLADTYPENALTVVQRIARQKVRIGVVGERGFRLALHYWIDDAAVEKTVAAICAAL